MSLLISLFTFWPHITKNRIIDFQRHIIAFVWTRIIAYVFFDIYFVYHKKVVL